MYNQRLDELAKLENGWDGYKSVPPTVEALATAKHMMPVPGGDGSVQLEMHAGDASVEIEIAADGKVESVYVRPNMGDSFIWERTR